MSRTGIIGQDITLSVNFYANGALFDPYSVGPVKIYDQSVGGTEIATFASTTKISTGRYSITWDVPDDIEAGTFYDSWTWTAASGMSETTRRYDFTLAPETIDGGVVVDDVDVVCRVKPTWEHLIGIRLVEDVGNGIGLRLTWGGALPANINNVVHYNVYYASTRLGVFDDGPKVMTLGQSIILNSFNPGDLQYLAVRATEFSTTAFDIEQMPQIGVGVYEYPDEDTLQSAITDAYETAVVISDASEYPDKGYILVDTEIMKYTSKDTTTFYIDEINRGAYGTVAQTHEAGETVSLWHGTEDGNTIIYLQTATWHDTQPQLDHAIGETNADSDGYRIAEEDVITTDLSGADAENVHFPSYDYTGYHRPSLQETFSGDCVHSYQGGDFNGSRGLFLQERNIARLDAQLQLTGQDAVLLKRKWVGRRCRCASELRHEAPRSRCSYCFGTGIAGNIAGQSGPANTISTVGGYDRYVNPRPVSEAQVNSQGLIKIRIEPFRDDVELTVDQGLRSPVEQSFWTLPVPTVKDRDVIVTFDPDGNVDWVYEILDVTRNRLFFGEVGRQQGTMRRMDRTDELYTYPKIII